MIGYGDYGYTGVGGGRKRRELMEKNHVDERRYASL